MEGPEMRSGVFLLGWKGYKNDKVYKLILNSYRYCDSLFIHKGRKGIVNVFMFTNKKGWTAVKTKIKHTSKAIF
jgi:hypothetical protein